MPVVLIISSQIDRVQNLSFDLAQFGLECSIVTADNGVFQKIEEEPSDIVLVDIHPSELWQNPWHLLRAIRDIQNGPAIALLSTDNLSDVEVASPMDDFIVNPWNGDEVALRIKRTLWQNNDIDNGTIVKHGDLVIDLEKYEVSVSGKLINLSFKEYELLKVLINNRDRVLTRDALLDSVWGYDYFGGDRTVDVHIRRLRSKIEDAEHSFIETVRNVGYRFKH